MSVPIGEYVKIGGKIKVTVPSMNITTFYGVGSAQQSFGLETLIQRREKNVCPGCSKQTKLWLDPARGNAVCDKCLGIFDFTFTT